jgi:hypothetical protein
MTSVGDAAVVDELVRGVQRSMVGHAFVDLQIPQHLAGGPLALADLSAATSTNLDALGRFLRAAEAVGLILATSDGRVGLSPAGRLLLPELPGNASGWLTLMTSPWINRAWEHLADAIRDGKSPFPRVHGVGFWEYVGGHPQEAGAFDALMTSGAAGRADDVLAALDWSSISLVVDVGGGQGLLVAALLSRAPNLRGIVADRAEVVAVPDPAALEMLERIEMVSADFFTDVPTGGDVYLLSRILHDWPDADAIAILRQCRLAMHDGAVLCVLEQIAPDVSDRAPQDQLDLAIKDLNMLVLVGGQERTAQHYARLLETSGFTMAAIHRGTVCDVIQARPTIQASP